MRHIVVAVLVLTAMIFADAPRIDNREKPLFMQGKVKIQLTETAQSSGMLKIDNSSKSYSLTGFKTLDELNMKHSATGVKNPFMESKDKESEKALGLDRWLIIDIPEATDVVSAVEDYKKDPNIEFACPEYLIYTTAAPSDPMYASQWGHNNTAQMLAWKSGDTYNHTGLPVGTVGFDARAQLGWDGSQGYGSSSVIIGIIDSGVDTAHEDINDVAGYDFGDNDTNPMDNSSAAGHGTCCAGVAAGIVNNGKGVAGVAGNCKIMPLKIANSAGSMTFTAITNAVKWGADNGAHVLSMSLGANVSPGYDTACDAAMVYAYNLGVVLLAATANNNATNIYYPSNHANVVGVGAASNSSGRKRSSSKTTEVNSGNYTDPNGVTIDNEIWWGSNYGVATKDAANAVDFLAPCILPTTDITGTAGYQSGNYYTYFNGTSSACPYAAGFAALIKSRYPSYTPAQIISLMKNTCTDIVNVESVAGWDKYSGYGLINIGAALGTGGTPPGVPVLVSPTNGSTVQDLTPTFDWNDVTDATSYTILVDNNSTFASPEVNTSPTSSTYTPGANLAAGTYYWKVLATNSSGSSAYSAAWTVTLTAPPPIPDVPVLVSPSNGSTVQDLTPTFDWNDAANATSYEILGDDKSNFSSPDINATVATSTYTVPIDLAAKTYYWKVRSVNVTGSSAYTAAWTVVVTAPPPLPGTPTLISPANASGTTDTTPSFDWSDATDATGYEILIDNNSDFSSPTISTTSATSDYTATTLALGTYYWKVRGTNVTGAGPYSAAWSYTIGSAPSVPVLATPANGSYTSDLTPTFDWNDVTGAISYTILVDNNSDFSSPEITNSPTVSTYTPAANLTIGTYYWKVLATNSYGSSTYSGSWSVSLGSPPSAPALVSPANGSTVTDFTPAFDWNDVSGAESYTILVDNNSDFSSPEINQSPTVSTYTPSDDLGYGTYYWKVSAENSYGTGSYSSTWSLTIPAPNIALSKSSVSTSADIEGTDTDSFNISNTGGTDLNYNITKEYVTGKADITVHSNDFTAGLGGYINSGTATWTAAGGRAVVSNETSSNLTGILTSTSFDGTACTSLTLSFDQVFTTAGLSTATVEYYNGTAWTQVYTASSSTSASQTLSLPVVSDNMQIKFTGAVRKNSADSWAIDNIMVYGPASGPVYTWLTISSALTGTVAASGSNTINLICSAAGLSAGTYNANITVASNDPDEPSKVLPVQFVVNQPTVIPGVPSNIVTSVVGTDLVIDWDAAADATSYDVYASDDPYGTFTFVTNVSTNQYSAPYSEAKKFWYVVSRNATK